MLKKRNTPTFRGASLLASCLLLTVGIACGGGAGSAGGTSSATVPDLGPSAPAADGKPLTFEVDGVELGMTEEEIEQAWGAPASGDFAKLWESRGEYESVEVGSVRRDHGQVSWSLKMIPKEKAPQDDVMAEFTERFGPPVTDAGEAAMIRMAAVTIGESETLFRAGRYAYVIARWESGEEGASLYQLDAVLHPQAMLDIPRTEWASLRYPIPLTWTAATRSEVKTLLGPNGPAEVTTGDVERILGPPVWKHPGSFDREAWLYFTWDSEMKVEVFFTDGIENGNATQFPD